LQRLKFLAVCLISGLITSVYVMIDSFVSHYYITDTIVLSVWSMWIGIIASSILMVLFQVIKVKQKNLGQIFDPEFSSIRLPRGKPFKYSLIGASFGGISTIAYFFALDIFDVSTILPLMQFVTIYLMAADFIVEKEIPVAVEIQSIIMITFGAILMTVSKEGLNIGSIFFILVLFNIPATIRTVFQGKSKNFKDDRDRSVDSLNLRMWFLMGLTASTTVLSLPFFLLDSRKLAAFFNIRIEGLILISISMLLVFIATALYIRALAMGKMAVVNAFTSVNIVFIAVFSMLGSFIFPEVFSFPLFDPLLIILRIAGTVLLLVGIFSLSFTDSYIYIFIELESTARYRTPVIMEFIKQIRGVNSVSSVCGVYDLIATARIRTLTRARSSILKALQEVPGLKRTDTRAAMYHWERN